MAISRNPDETPKADPKQDDEAFIVGLRRIQIIIETPEDQPDDPDTPPISAYVYAYFIPRKGEVLILDDGKKAEVKDVYQKIGTVGKSKMKALIPIVYAELRRD
jgi:hypothetical protein